MSQTDKVALMKNRKRILVPVVLSALVVLVAVVVIIVILPMISNCQQEHPG